MILNEKCPLISVIIPVYNVEEYLSDCVNSVIDQTYNNFEIILINDGSTDSSYSICLDYVAKHHNIIVINQENKGLSDARNKGIERAKGEYIAFIDSDDLIHKNYLNILLNHLGSADISVCSIQKFRQENTPNLNQELTVNLKELTGKEMNEYLYSEHHSNTAIIATNKLFKKHLWDKIRFPLGKLHEDCFVIYKIIDMANQVKLIDIPLYFYRTRDDSITSKRTFKSLKDEYDATSEQILFFTQKNQLKIIKNANRYRKTLFLHPALDKNWDTWKNYSILQIFEDDLRTREKYKLIKKKIALLLR